MTLLSKENIPIAVQFTMTTQQGLDYIIEVLKKRHDEMIQQDNSTELELGEQFILELCWIENFLQDLDVPGFEFS